MAMTAAMAVAWRWRRGEGGEGGGDGDAARAAAMVGARGGSRWTRQDEGAVMAGARGGLDGQGRTRGRGGGEDSGAVWGRKSRFHSVW